MTDLHSRARAFVDDELLDAYWHAVDHYETKDLVLYLDPSNADDPLHVFVREDLLNNPKAPEELKSKVARPAKELGENLKDASTSFWLLVNFENEQQIIPLAVNAQRTSSGGSA